MNTTATPTEKQVSYLQSLRASRTPNVSEQAVAQWVTTVDRATVSKKIDELKAMPIVAGPLSSKAQIAQQQAKVTRPEPEDGIYFVPDAEGPGNIFKVYKMVHGSGRQGVKRLVVEDQEGSFLYLGLAVKHLPLEAKKMSLEEAQAFGRLYGFCVRCGATLTDEDSIARGLGPVCAGKF